MRRETRRLRRQITSLVMSPFEAARRVRYDHGRAEQIKRTTGLRPAQSCIAIYLIYQPERVLGSTLLTCQFLNSNGFAVHVVSNAPLSVADREALARDCTLILERPNYGYDFGGYRDGILDVLDRGLRPDRLLVMNDSIWFPLFEDTDLLDRMRDAPFDIFGPWMRRHPTTSSKDHIASYMFGFSQKILQDPRFARYWRNLHMSDDKTTVIRRNEVQMTHQLGKLGFSTGSLHDVRDIVAVSQTMSASELRAYVEQQARGPLASSARAEAQKLLDLRAHNDEASWVTNVRDHIARQRVGKHLIAVHPLVSISRLRVPLLKKDRDPQFRYIRKILRALPEFQQVPAVIRHEIEGWDRD